MQAEQLRSWQPQATLEQLSDFIHQNQTLMTLLEEAWQKFAATLPDNPPPAYVSNYGAGVDLDTLEHFPVSQAEMIEFLNHFEKERYHNDRPFGDSIHINEQDWTLSEWEDKEK